MPLTVEEHALTTVGVPVRTLKERLLAIGLTLTVGAALASVAVAREWPNVRPDCTVAYAGSAANIEFSGLGAGAVCLRYAWQDPRFHESVASGQVKCRVQMQGVAATVRDGRDDWYGGLMCGYLFDRQTKGAGF